MSNNLIDVLKQQVSAMVLEGETTFFTEKNTALSLFYPILLSILRGKPSLIERLRDQLNPRLNDLFEGHPALKPQFLDSLRGAAPAPFAGTRACAGRRRADRCCSCLPARCSDTGRSPSCSSR